MTEHQAKRRLLVVDDDDGVARAIARVCRDTATVHAVSTCADARAIAERPDVALVDLGLPDGDGVDLVASLAARFEDLPVIVITVNASDARVLASFRAGARGYVLKEDLATRLGAAIDDALAGGAPMSPSIARRILKLVTAAPAPTSPLPDALTDREVDVVRALASGQSYEHVARDLGVSINTLRSHVRNVYRKLSAGSRTEAVLAAIRLGLVRAP